MNANRATFGSLGVLLGVLLLPTLRAAQDGPSSKSDPTFSYAAHFTCGTDPPQGVDRIMPGQYATGIQIFNPNDEEVPFRNRIALTFPDASGEAGPNPGLVSKWITNSVPPGTALMVDCGEIPEDFLPGLPFPPYLQGFFVIESRGSLQVTAVYTAAAIDAKGNTTVQTMDVEVVPERIISSSPEKSPL